jgi:hypothetical protein
MSRDNQVAWSAPEDTRCVPLEWLMILCSLIAGAAVAYWWIVQQWI